MKKNLIHCSYHKCLTKFYSNVMRSLYKGIVDDGIGKRRVNAFKHFSSFIDDFYSDFSTYRIASINNHPLDFSKLGNYRISRFIRDPRDLIVSGYHYHKRGAENWCQIKDPTEQDWLVVNGVRPGQMSKEDSFQTYLESLNQENGLIAEIKFRKNHLDSMLQWPDDDPRIKLFRYEDMVGNLPSIFSELFDFYGLPEREKLYAVKLAESFSGSGSDVPGVLKKHIRDPRPNQWKSHFTSNVSSFFMERYGALLKKYGYE